jgi:hypothetical protein
MACVHQLAEASSIAGPHCLSGIENAPVFRNDVARPAPNPLVVDATELLEFGVA